MLGWLFDYSEGLGDVSPDPDSYMYLFDREDTPVLALWSEDRVNRQLTLAADPASYEMYDLMGNPEEGLWLYQKYCQVCHGEEGEGDGIMTKLMGINPMDHTNPNMTGRLDNDELVRSILDGKGRYMPAWRGILTQDDVEALVSYIRLLSQ